MFIGIANRIPKLSDLAGFAPSALSNLVLWMRADTGVATGGARKFTNGNSEYFTGGDDTDFEPGDADFTIAGWVYLDNLDTAQGFCGKYDFGDNNREYLVFYQQSSNRIRFHVSGDGQGGASITQLVASTLGAPSAGQWYFIVAWHDATANTINIQVNNGTVDSESHTAGIFQGTANFLLGSEEQTSPAFQLDGRMAKWGFWDRTLTADERTSLYNNGNGLTYGSLSSGLKTSLVSYWKTQAML